MTRRMRGYLLVVGMILFSSAGVWEIARAASLWR